MDSLFSDPTPVLNKEIYSFPLKEVGGVSCSSAGNKGHVSENPSSLVDVLTVLKNFQVGFSLNPLI